VLRMLAKNFGLMVARGLGQALRLFQRRNVSAKAIYILMKRPLGIGDLMMLSPFIIEVARRAKGTPTYLVTEHEPFMHLDNVTWILPAQLSRRACRSALLVSPTLSWRHTPYLCYAGWYIGYFFSERVTCNFSSESPSYDGREGHYYDRVERLLSILDRWLPGETSSRSYAKICSTSIAKFNLPEQYVCIAPYVGWDERQYPIAHLASVVEKLLPVISIVLVGGNDPAEKRMSEILAQQRVINLVGKTTLSEAAGIIYNASLFIGNDSGLAHIAVLGGIWSIVMFGCVGGYQRIPLDSALARNAKFIGAGKSCRHFPCYDGFNKPCCRNDHRYKCLSDLAPDMVVEMSVNFLKDQKNS